MKPMEIVDRLKEDNPAIFERLPDRRAARIIRLALLELGKEIDSVDEGSVSIPGLGSFRIRQVEQEKAGHTGMTKRIVFRGSRAAAPK